MTLEIITCDAITPIRHGFFSRQGGASSGIFKGLNCGQGSSDQREVVLLNRSMVSDAMNVGIDSLCSVHQCHSNRVVTVTEPLLGTKPKADAMVTNTPGLALGILTADCAPILFADAKAKVIGAAHSGWKGAMGGIAKSTVDAMVDLGANRDEIRATVGPCISQRNYEVGDEFFEDFVAQDPDNARFFANGQGGKYHFDLPSFCLSALRAAEVVHVNWTGHCTYADPDRFYSYRRATHMGEPDYGRLISAITL